MAWSNRRLEMSAIVLDVQLWERYNTVLRRKE
jgi:hypothetical protein